MIDNKFVLTDANIDFIEKMLKPLPSNIYYKDGEGRYVFCTHYWNHLEVPDNDMSWSIRGKYDVDIRKDKENALRAMEEDKKILSTGIGVSYEIKIEIDDKLEYYQIIKDPVFDDEGKVIGIVGLINDITQMKLLEEKLERLAARDSLTGVYNRSYINIWFEKNQGRIEFPFSIIVGDCNGLKRVNDKYGHLVGDKYIKTTALFMENNLCKNGCVIRSGGDEFIAFLPGTDEEAAGRYIETVKAEISSVHIFEETCSVSMGYATINEQTDNYEDIIKLADDRMYENKALFYKLKEMK